MLAGCFAGKHVVQLGSIGAADGMDVIGSLHAAFEFEGACPRAKELGQQVDGAIVAWAKGTFATGGRHHVAAYIEHFVGEAARLGAHASICGSSGAGKARKLAEPGIAKADSAMAKDLEVDIDARDLVDFLEGKLARERYAIGANLAAPGGPTLVMDIGLRGNMGLHLRHQALDFKEEAPVLNDEGIGA